MQTPVKVFFKGMEPSEALEQKINGRVQKLEKTFHHITGCQVTVELPHQNKEQGKIYSVHIKLDVPNQTLVVNKDKHKNHAHEDAYVAVRDAFDAMQRLLQDYVRKMRGDVKVHEEPPVARVSSLFPEDGYGFIQTADNREIYFNENSIIKADFEQLQIGDSVRFNEVMGDKGPQASSVIVLK